MVEKVYRTMKRIGILNLVLGISTIVTGIGLGVSIMVSGICLLKSKSTLTF